jgi:hypothetical protein
MATPTREVIKMTVEKQSDHSRIITFRKYIYPPKGWSGHRIFKWQIGIRVNKKQYNTMLKPMLINDNVIPKSYRMLYKSVETEVSQDDMGTIIGYIRLINKGI